MATTMDANSWMQSGMQTATQVTIEATTNKNNNHNMPPSKVIHCRAVAEGCKETDLVQVMKIFGNIKALKLMPKIGQSLVEFEELESAIACVTYSQLQPILLHSRQMYVNYSKSSEINRQFANANQVRTPTGILLFTIINVIHPVTVDTIKKICEQQNIEVQRIVIFHKNGLQALVEFKSIEDATRIQQTLDGCDIYPGCCTLKIEYSKSKKLNVRSNTTESYDVDMSNSGYGELLSSSEQLSSGKGADASVLLAGAEGYPAVQSILARVMATGSVSGNQSHLPSEVKSLLANHMGVDPTYANYQNSMQNSMQANPDNYLDNYTSPFVDVDAGGDGCVAMVYGVNNEVVNCEHLYNLFCLYGNVVKVKVLVNKPGCAMVQYGERLSTELAIQNLNNLGLFGEQLSISFSKHASISDSRQVATLFDGSPTLVSYSESRNNRFKFVPGGKNNLFSRIHPPSKVLHYFNAPPDITEERLQQVFESFKAEVPVKQAQISKPNSKSASGLLEFTSVSAAVEALILVNHITLHKDSIDGEVMPMAEKTGAPFTFKLAFSSSESINK